MKNKPETKHLYLETQRLTLEPVTAQHAEELFELFRDPTLHLYVPTDPPTIEEQRERCERWSKRQSPDGTETWLNWIARDKKTGKAAAHFQVGFKVATASNEPIVATIGYVVGISFQKKGFATEGLTAVFHFLRDHCAVREVKAYSDTRNLASHKLAKKLGMIQIDFIKDADFFKGATSDEFVFSKKLVS